MMNVKHMTPASRMKVAKIRSTSLFGLKSPKPTVDIVVKVSSSEGGPVLGTDIDRMESAKSTFQNTILLNMSKRNSGVQVHNLILHLQILHWILQTFIFSHQMQIF